MKKTRYSLIFFLLIISVLAKAQYAYDSVYFYQQDRQYLENTLFSPSISSTADLSSYGFLTLQWHHQQGGLRRAQEAFTINLPSFVAKGYKKIGKYSVSGSFEFNKSFEDSLANGQKNNLEDFTTFYPYANKSGIYERQNYIINTTLSREILTNKVSAFIGMDYHKHWSTSSVDPRLNANRFIVKFKPGFSFSFGKHQLGVFGLLGKADEQVSISYKNSDFKTSLLYPDRIHYMQYGYGSSVIKDSSSVYKYDNYKGLGLEYALDNKQIDIQFKASYETLLNKNYNKSRSTPGFATVAIFRLNTLKSALLLRKHSSSTHNYLLHIDAEYNFGYDGNLKTSGSLNRVNYKVNALKLNSSFLYLWDKKQATSKEIGLKLAYNQQQKEDLGQSDALNYQTLQLNIETRLYHQFDENQNIKFGLSPYYLLPLATQLKYNTNSTTEFIRNVVFTDYYYYQSKSLGMLLSTEFSTKKMIKNQHVGLFFNLDYRKKLKQDLRTDLNPSFIPNKYRWATQIGINMYL